jgi:hypothetical protein
MIYAVVALAVMAPLLLPGHIMTLDMALTPNLPLPEISSSSFVFRLLLYLLNIVVPTHIIEKALFLAILMLSSLGMHQLISRSFPRKNDDLASEWGIYVAGALYAINPFTYSRFMAGQYSVLLGYALLPFFVRTILDFLAQPNRKRGILLVLWTLAISIVSIHSIGLIAIFAVCAFGASVWRYRKKPGHIRSILKFGVAAFMTVLLASSYWLVPFLTGDNSAGQAAQRFTVGDRQAYATTGSGAVERFGNVIQLQGFWAEAKDLYLLPQEYIPLWGFVTLGIWILVGAGFKSLLQGGRRYEAFILAMAGAASVLLAMAGVGGFREPQKFIGLLAMAFAFLAAHGIPRVIHWLSSKTGETVALVGLCAVLILPVLWTPTMFWGFAGQLRPRAYPADWFIANEKLNQDTGDFKVLFLPWHLYMHFRFAGRIIVNPACDFFDKPIIVSNDPELQGSSLADQDPQKAKLSRDILPDAATNPGFARELGNENIKYILLAKETDAEAYNYLNHQAALELVYESDTILLYRNKAWEGRHAR